ncbi:hypothetical protein [Bacillus sp. NEB1478]|uniref:hypothetical protein n=1 Tax=Bacillus sp. NEB1478 TaxID=3073816 RepID=UPI002873DF50|nr:hypothetical protein [Bacillus sp. NEB1478]WNB93409.1 hypothetical protein RGB74_06995 [Bacillus sp. NEB1478]
MEYNFLYLIESGNNSVVVSAKNSIEAIGLWIEQKNKEIEEDGRLVKFNPTNYSVKQIEREDLIIRAPK